MEVTEQPEPQPLSESLLADLNRMSGSGSIYGWRRNSQGEIVLLVKEGTIADRFPGHAFGVPGRIRLLPIQPGEEPSQDLIDAAVSTGFTGLSIHSRQDMTRTVVRPEVPGDRDPRSQRNNIGATVEPRKKFGLFETRELWHPESPGVRVRVRVFCKSPRRNFATLGQVVRMYSRMERGHSPQASQGRSVSR